MSVTALDAVQRRGDAREPIRAAIPARPSSPTRRGTRYYALDDPQCPVGKHLSPIAHTLNYNADQPKPVMEPNEPLVSQASRSLPHARSANLGGGDRNGWSVHWIRSRRHERRRYPQPELVGVQRHHCVVRRSGLGSCDGSASWLGGGPIPARHSYWCGRHRLIRLDWRSRDHACRVTNRFGSSTTGRPLTW